MIMDKSDPELSLTLEESDDEAPEEVTFETARNEALRQVKKSLETAKREKEQLKEKRRKRQELFQEQKKKRLLPADVLEEIDAKKQKASQEEDQEDPEEEEDEKLTDSRNLSETYTVTTKKEQTSFQQQAAQDFLQSRLYGAHSRRSTNNEILSVQNKKGTHKREAVQFVKKNWASKEKAKADKLKKRWLHKQNI